MAIQIDVVVVVIDKVRESGAFAHFVGMLVEPLALKQGATTMPTNFRPQIWFQVIISVIGS